MINMCCYLVDQNVLDVVQIIFGYMMLKIDHLQNQLLNVQSKQDSKHSQLAIKKEIKVQCLDI